MVGVAGGACLSSGAELQGLTTGVLGEIGVVGSTWGKNNYSTTQLLASDCGTKATFMQQDLIKTNVQQGEIRPD